MKGVGAGVTGGVGACSEGGGCWSDWRRGTSEGDMLE